jgi:putative MFS transporter
MESTATGAVSSAGLQESAQRDLSEEIPFKDAFMVALAAGLGYGFDAYAVNIYGLVLPAITATLGIGSGTAGVIGSIFLIGYTLGTIGFGVAADKYGRKDTLGVSILMYGLTTSLGGIGGNVVWFTIMRFLTGIGGAGELAVGAPYTCEMFKSKYRALGTGGIMFSLYSLGYILAGVVALVLVPSWGWEAAFLVAIIPAIAVFAFRRFISESVRYVIDKAEDKFSAAQALLAAEHEGASAQERAAAVAQIEKEETKAERPAALDAAQATPRAGSGPSTPLVAGLLVVALAALFIGLLADVSTVLAAVLVTGAAVAILFTMALFSTQRGKTERFWQIPGVRKRIGIGWLLYTANAMGYWGITTFLTTFMVTKFDVSPTTAIKYAIIFYICQFFFSYIGTGLSDWVGRRPAGILGALIMITCTILAATASELGVFLVFGAIQIAMLGWLWGVGDTYLSEMFPTSIRGSCFGIGCGGGRVMSISAPFLVGAGIAAFGPTTPFLASAGLWVLTIVGYLIGPETSGKSLEQIEAEFVAEGARA